MATIKEASKYHSKEVVIDSDGDLVIWHGDENVVLDKEQVIHLKKLIDKYLEAGDVD
ncbi:hypothetical protein [Pantoea conspicua]|uniref:hypothetical protein n=1 Tax=Pantoea conspicua TaxID=472705 RepID=UPI001301F0AD|nr:hypothetical protein [Pantoea conspicua]